jgi:membrane dipeptidase
MVGVNFGVRFLRDDGERTLDTPLSQVVRHVDYLVEKLGIERVGFGSDFDGAIMPEPLDDVSKLPDLLEALREHGYSDAELRMLAHENWVRVLKKTWGE